MSWLSVASKAIKLRLHCILGVDRMVGRDGQALNLKLIRPIFSSSRCTTCQQDPETQESEKEAETQFQSIRRTVPSAGFAGNSNATRAPVTRYAKP